MENIKASFRHQFLDVGRMEQRLGGNLCIDWELGLCASFRGVFCYALFNVPHSSTLALSSSIQHMNRVRRLNT
jgi:hypothetical protein